MPQILLQGKTVIKLNLGHNNVKYYVPVQVKITTDFRRRPKGFFYLSEWRLVRGIIWIIFEGFTEVSGLLSSSVIFVWAAPLSFPAVYIAGYLCHLSLYPLVPICLDLSGPAWTGQTKVVLMDRPVMWLIAMLYLQSWKGSGRVNLSCPLYHQQASQSALPHWPLSQLRAGNEIFGNQTIRLPFVYCFLFSVW